MTTDNCLICNPVRDNISTRSTNHFDCLRCGRFSITFEAARNWISASPTDRQKANASGWLKEHQEVALDSTNIDSLLSIPSPNFSDRVDKLLVEMSNMTPALGETLNVDQNVARLISASWSLDKRELNFLLINYMQNEAGYIAHSHFSSDKEYVTTITPRGYSRLDDLRAEPVNSQMGFCAMWFDESVEHIWTKVIEPAISSAGYEPTLRLELFVLMLFLPRLVRSI
jgi:hypothetical protein